MTNPLFDRQARLLAYLTSGSAIFGQGTLPSELQEFDSGLLQLEARFSYEKRVAKIASVLPRTFALMGPDGDRLLADFVDNCPPETLATVANARQFCSYLADCWRRQQRVSPPYLPDVAACELALAEIRNPRESNAPMRGPAPSAKGAVRRARNMILLRCAYDVRPIFEDEADAAPAERETTVAILLPSRDAPPVIAALQPAVFDFLSAVEDFTLRSAFADMPQADRMLEALIENGLVEVAN